MNDANAAAWIFFGFLGLYILFTLMSRPQHTWWTISIAAVCVLACGFAVSTLPGAMGWDYSESLAAGLVATLIYAQLTKPHRSRHIPAKVRRQVIERDTGRRRLRRDEHIDHIVPQSKGGEHVPENLRVISKKKNLEKSDHDPTLFDFIGRLLR